MRDRGKGKFPVLMADAADDVQCLYQGQVRAFLQRMGAIIPDDPPELSTKESPLLSFDNPPDDYSIAAYFPLMSCGVLPRNLQTSLEDTCRLQYQRFVQVASLPLQQNNGVAEVIRRGRINTPTLSSQRRTVFDAVLEDIPTLAHDCEALHIRSRKLLSSLALECSEHIEITHQRFSGDQTPRSGDIMFNRKVLQRRKQQFSVLFSEYNEKLDAAHAQRTLHPPQELPVTARIRDLAETSRRLGLGYLGTALEHAYPLAFKGVGGSQTREELDQAMIRFQADLIARCEAGFPTFIVADWSNGGFLPLSYLISSVAPEAHVITSMKPLASDMSSFSHMDQTHIHRLLPCFSQQWCERIMVETPEEEEVTGSPRSSQRKLRGSQQRVGVRFASDERPAAEKTQIRATFINAPMGVIDLLQVPPLRIDDALSVLHRLSLPARPYVVLLPASFTGQALESLGRLSFKESAPISVLRSFLFTAQVPQSLTPMVRTIHTPTPPTVHHNQYNSSIPTIHTVESLSSEFLHLDIRQIPVLSLAPLREVGGVRVIEGPRTTSPPQTKDTQHLVAEPHSVRAWLRGRTPKPLSLSEQTRGKARRTTVSTTGVLDIRTLLLRDDSGSESLQQEISLLGPEERSTLSVTSPADTITYLTLDHMPALLPRATGSCALLGAVRSLDTLGPRDDLASLLDVRRGEFGEPQRIAGGRHELRAALRSDSCAYAVARQIVRSARREAQLIGVILPAQQDFSALKHALAGVLRGRIPPTIRLLLLTPGALQQFEPSVTNYSASPTSGTVDAIPSVPNAFVVCSSHPLPERLLLAIGAGNGVLSVTQMPWETQITLYPTSVAISRVVRMSSFVPLGPSLVPSANSVRKTTLRLEQVIGNGPSSASLSTFAREQLPQITDSIVNSGLELVLREQEEDLFGTSVAESTYHFLGLARSAQMVQKSKADAVTGAVKQMAQPGAAAQQEGLQIWTVVEDRLLLKLLSDPTIDLPHIISQMGVLSSSTGRYFTDRAIQMRAERLQSKQTRDLPVVNIFSLGVCMATAAQHMVGIVAQHSFLDAVEVQQPSNDDLLQEIDNLFVSINTSI